MFLLCSFYKIHCLFYLFGRWAKIPKISVLLNCLNNNIRSVNPQVPLQKIFSKDIIK